MLEAGVATLRRARGRRLGALGLASAAVLAVVGASLLANAIVYWGSVVPGVTVAGVDVGGLPRAEARVRIEAEIGKRLERPLAVTVGTRRFAARPSELFFLDAAASERAAFERGRDSLPGRVGALAVPLGLEYEIEPVLRVRRGPGLQALARALRRANRPAVSARIRMRGLEPIVLAGREGTRVDMASALDSVRSAALSGLRSVRIAVLPERPAIAAAAAQEAAERARRIVAAPMELTFRGERVGELSPRTLARLVRFRPAGDRYHVVLAPEPLGRALAPKVADATREPVEASFRVIGERVRVVRSRPGTQVAASKVAGSILAASAGDGPRAAVIVLTKRAADLTTREAKALGIRTRISTFTTDMGPSSANRIWNVQLLGRLLDGTVVRAGETFSFNRAMGPRTTERGFRVGQMIVGGVLVPAVGGGVCQTATTIFNTAFEAGLPILERKNHSLYISHYPLGRDAAVSWGGPDLVFRNDLDSAILIKAHGTSETFTVTFYGTKQGRRVKASTSEPTNYTQAGAGFDVSVTRRVYERGRLLRKDTFFTLYTA